MRFILGVLVGYSMRGREKRLITVLATIAFIVYIVLPVTALLALSLDVRKERQSRPAQTRVPTLKGLTYEDAETKLHASNLNIRLLATRYDLPFQPGLIIDQVPQPGEEVVYGYPVGVTVTEADSPWPPVGNLGAGLTNKGTPRQRVPDYREGRRLASQ
jgi:PASTA domain